MQTNNVQNERFTGFSKYLLLYELISKAELQKQITKAQTNKATLIRTLISSNIIEPYALASAIASHFSLPLASLVQSFSNTLFNNKSEEEIAFKYQIIPLVKTNGKLSIAISDPTDIRAINEIKFHTQMDVQLIIVEHTQLSAMIELLRQTKHCHTLEKRDGIIHKTNVEDNSVIQFIDDIILSAIQKEASDVHFEPYEKNYRIRFRIDGILHEITKVDLMFAQRLGVRLKIMSRLDIADRRLPQDGRFTFQKNDHMRDCRINSCPTSFGEKIVVRLLNQNKINLCLDALGLENDQQALFLRHIQKPSGMVLVTGPTGSGKTISLYTALNILNTEYINISAVEDPIEISLSGINQVEVNHKTGLTFATALRAFLRQDPDVIMVGEIRDIETAQIAIKAAQTGHLVLATLHTNTALEAIIRLLNMGIPAFTLINTITLVVAQRLARKLCDFCKEQQFSQKQTILDTLHITECDDSLATYVATGCDKCNKGYKGRIGIFELMPITQSIGKMLLENNHLHDIARQAKRDGVQNLQESAFFKIKQGVTSIAEINRVLI